MDQNSYEILLESIEAAGALERQVMFSVAIGKLKTASAYLVRARRLLKKAQAILDKPPES